MSARNGIGITFLIGVLLMPVLAVAQNPTGTLTGTITDINGDNLPGVTVTATSDKMQGSRVVVTGAGGGYKLAFLPPGEYEISFVLEGFNQSVRQVKISAAQSSKSDITLEIGAIAEVIEVTSMRETISETTTGAMTITSTELESLPVSRDLSSAINLSPGVANTGVSSAPSISGEMSYQNLWLVNGVVINENIRGSVLPLYIEDAIQETTTAVSGISAEYGRFTGGVVNAITKSGGNQFDGSLRTNMTNEDWESKTPLSGERVDDINQSYEATLGGYFWKDHIWFFGAGRDVESSESRQTNFTNRQYPYADAETRFEAKLTAALTPSHTVIGSYLEIDRVRNNTDFGTILDFRSLNPAREDPQEIMSLNYTGILSDAFFIEAQYSEREFIIGVGSGGPRDLVNGTLMRTRSESFRYWAPTFCGPCDDEERSNTNLLAKASWFLDTDATGTHDIVFGYDTFEDIRFVVNHQTGSDFTIYGNDVIRDANDVAILDPIFGSAYPVLDPSLSSTYPRIRWFAIFNEDLAQPTSFKTNSFYVNDRWQFNDKLSFNAGLRYDINDGVDSQGAKVADDSKVSPRLGVAYDLKGDGDLVLTANYGTYVSALANNIGTDASAGGAVGSYRFKYDGVPLNVGCTPGVDCLTADVVIRTVFDWYEAQGGVYDLDLIDPNAPIWSDEYFIDASIPGATTQIQGGIKSPGTTEYTLGMTKRLGSKGMVRADLVFRKGEDFYGFRTTLDTGKIDLPTGTEDVSLSGNFNSGVTREYQGLHTNFRYRFTDKFQLAGNYTLSRSEGNFVGEASNSGPGSASTEHYPEYREARWNSPIGDLQNDQRHKLRVWGVYDILRTKHNRLNASLLFNYFSGQPYGASAGINSRPYVTNPGYETPPSTVTYWFTNRDAFHTDDVTRTDLALSYSFDFTAWGQDFAIFIQPTMQNVFNEQAVDDPNSSIRLLDDFNPFTETPVEGVHWEKRDTFGQPDNEFDYQSPRTFRLSVGFRF